MNPPTCKLCESRHWLDEGHKITGALEETRKVGASVLGMGVHQGSPTQLGGLPIKRTEKVLNGQSRPEKNKRTLIKRTEGPTEPTVTRGRPKKWASEAERKRAYRGRSRG